MRYQRSSELFAEAKKYIPGGVNSPVRAFKAVGGEPIFIKEAKGAYLKDEDGNTYIDYISSWGPLLFGHAHAPVIKAVVEKAAGSGAVTFGSPNSPGVTQGTAKDTLLANYNDLEGVKELVAANTGEIAAIILEPIAGNMGCCCTC